MITSMTGFGQANRSFGGFKVFIEVKSVNHRYAEIAIRMPKEWVRYEDSLKKTLLQTVKRGRVEVYVTAEREAGTLQAISVDWTLADGYMNAAEQIKARYGFTERLSLTDMLGLPDLIHRHEERSELDESFEHELCGCLDEAARELIQMRQKEGSFLKQDLTERLQELIRLHAELQRFTPLVVKEYAGKLRYRIGELLQDQTPVDEQRLAAEIAIFADRSNVDEELTRLQSHFGQFNQLLGSAEPVGRKLDFLIQEMNREVNTIGSKANFTELTAKVIDMKAELEKMREQIQNIE
ncbi:YicC/YloC family endoribonuclease [Paenibacillus sp. GP183]|uniref:YicC/YloC family endoribonuclease n=1 Tax=Paenibacillus sp. GP183 TaxID=1882751 RepID=UPI00089D40AC|nr:YicC/YloC family endoribonuclease [Paenibacillus sp. GP183]SEB44343.1 TIGR00255 family protein [Paenibacillus sp. GP183]